MNFFNEFVCFSHTNRRLQPRQVLTSWVTFFLPGLRCHLCRKKPCCSGRSAPLLRWVLVAVVLPQNPRKIVAIKVDVRTWHLPAAPVFRTSCRDLCRRCSSAGRTVGSVRVRRRNALEERRGAALQPGAALRDKLGNNRTQGGSISRAVAFYYSHMTQINKWCFYRTGLVA